MGGLFRSPELPPIPIATPAASEVGIARDQEADRAEARARARRGLRSTIQSTARGVVQRRKLVPVSPATRKSLLGE